MKIKTDLFIFDTKKSVLSFDIFQSLPNNFNIDYWKQFREIRLQEIQKSNKTLNWISLIPTLRCDGNCPYCYNAKFREKSLDLTVEKIESYINQLKNYNFDSVRFIRTYGGEPLLHPHLFDLYDYLIKRFPKIKNVYISSGLLFNDKTFENALIELKKISKLPIHLSIGISMDFGIPNDKFTRISHKAQIYSRDILLERVKIIENEIPNIEIIFPTIISKDVDPKLLKEHIDYWSKFKYKFRLEIANDNIYYPRKNQLIEIYRYLKSIIQKGNIYVYANTDILNIPKIIKINENNYWFLFPYSFCGIYTNMISFNPYGITPCHTIPFNFEYKNPKKEYFNHWNSDKCKKCDFYPICRGLCTTRMQYNEESNKAYCLWSKLSFILSIYKIECDYGNQLKTYLDKIKVKELK
jgi:radical SAM protein with 4Fe4S-binding SPASM domain